MIGQPARTEEQRPAEVAAALDRGVASVLRTQEQVLAAEAEFEQRHRQAMLESLPRSSSDSTIRAYARDWAVWASWCAEEGRQPLPARGLDVAVFLTACAHATIVTESPDGTASTQPRYAFTTIKRRRDAIAAVHRAQGQPSPTADPIVQQTMDVIRRTHERRPRGYQALDSDQIAEIIARLPPPGWPGGLRRRYDRLVLLIGFAGGLTSPEIASLSIDDVAVQREPHSDATLLLVRVGTTSDATGQYEEAAVLTRSDGPSVCPVCAFAEWIEVLEVHAEGGKDEVRRFLQADTGEPDSAHVCSEYAGTVLADGTRRPLFPTSYRSTHIGDKPITAQTVNNIVKRNVEIIGLDPDHFVGQSLRAGSTTAVGMGGSPERTALGQAGWETRALSNRIRRRVSG